MSTAGKRLWKRYRFHKGEKNCCRRSKERYDSVCEGLKEAECEGYVFIHDGARPFVDEEIIRAGL